MNFDYWISDYEYFYTLADARKSIRKRIKEDDKEFTYWHRFGPCRSFCRVCRETDNVRWFRL